MNECDQCVATMINGVFCHEHGCPVARAEILERAAHNVILFKEEAQVLADDWDNKMLGDDAIFFENVEMGNK